MYANELFQDTKRTVIPMIKRDLEQKIFGYEERLGIFYRDFNALAKNRQILEAFGESRDAFHALYGERHFEDQRSLFN